jgi:hypothetical protein
VNKHLESALDALIAAARDVHDSANTTESKSAVGSFRYQLRRVLRHLRHNPGASNSFDDLNP